MRDEWHHAFLLHRRDYRETSVLADFFTLDHGVISGVVKGIRRSSKTQRLTLQPFTLLNIGWYGAGDLKSIKMVETVEAAPLLVNEQLFCGFYINELLLRLLNRYDPYPLLFTDYQETLKKLISCKKEDVEIVLRIFEKKLLTILGYGFNFMQDSDGEPLHEQAQYLFESDYGFVRMTTSPTRDQQSLVYQGDVLMAIAHDDYESIDTRRAAKRLMRVALAHYLGGKPLHSRQLFQKVKEE